MEVLCRMTMQEIWMIKEELSEKFWGKTADAPIAPHPQGGTP